eukprot:4430992-Amphidinium_carterae.1
MGFWSGKKPAVQQVSWASCSHRMLITLSLECIRKVRCRCIGKCVLQASTLRLAGQAALKYLSEHTCRTL